MPLDVPIYPLPYTACPHYLESEMSCCTHHFSAPDTVSNSSGTKNKSGLSSALQDLAVALFPPVSSGVQLFPDQGLAALLLTIAHFSPGYLGALSSP